MNCYKWKCRYIKNNVCSVDHKPCDKEGEHCRQENNEDLRQVNPDTIFCLDVPKEFQRLPFWSCENICRYYDTCQET